jgi:predicted MFS family arabinose efflux permease
MTATESTVTTQSARGRSGMLGVLRDRDFRLLWTGETASCLGSSIGGVSLPLVALIVLHASVFAISTLTAAAWLPWLLIGLPAGAWVDRLPRRRVMIAADLVSLGAFASVPIAAWCGCLTISQLLVVALAGGTAAVFFKTAYRAFLPAMLSADKLLEGNAKLQGSEQVANVAGPGAAGLIAQAAGAVLGVLADAASFAISALCLTRIQIREPKPAARKPNLRTDIAEGLAIVIRDPLLRVTTVYGCLSNFLLVGYQSVLIVFLIKVVGLSAGVAGLLLALTSLGGVAGAMLARTLARRFGTARAVLYCKTGLAPCGLLIPLADRGPGLALFVLGSIAVIGGIIAGNIIWSGFVQSYYPSRMLGRVSTSTQVFNFGAIPAGAVVAGLLASHFGVRPTLWIMLGGLVLSSGILLLSPLPRMRDLPSHP